MMEADFDQVFEWMGSAREEVQMNIQHLSGLEHVGNGDCHAPFNLVQIHALEVDSRSLSRYSYVGNFSMDLNASYPRDKSPRHQLDLLLFGYLTGSERSRNHGAEAADCEGPVDG